jgi:hypothetical protein
VETRPTPYNALNPIPIDATQEKNIFVAFLKINNDKKFIKLEEKIDAPTQD